MKLYKTTRTFIQQSGQNISRTNMKGSQAKWKDYWAVLPMSVHVFPVICTSYELREMGKLRPNLEWHIAFSCLIWFANTKVSDLVWCILEDEWKKVLIEL